MAKESDDLMDALPEGILSLLDTDLYKLTMQCCVLKYFPDVDVTYSFTNRTPDMKFNRRAFIWLQKQIEKLGTLTLTPEESQYLKNTCPYLSESYLTYLSTFKLRPSEQVHISFHPIQKSANSREEEEDIGEIKLHTAGTWLETILYEIPLLALLSEAYFKHVDTDWTYDDQISRAKGKGKVLLQAGCTFSEFGSRRRRNYHTHNLVIRGLLQAQKEADEDVTRDGSTNGKFAGTSNVHLAMKYGIPPIGTVAHEWFMGIAAITNDYENANELALRYWTETFGQGVLAIALTDTFGTPNFLKAFARKAECCGGKSYAHAFDGVRQDSGDPATFAKLMHDFYEEQGIAEKKAVVFSDSLNVELCLKFKKVAEELNLRPSFGIGTFFTNDYSHTSTGLKSTPLNIVIKLSSCAGRPAVKISDNVGKNTGDPDTVAEVKRRLGYAEKEWKDGDESTRWGTSGAA